MASPGELCSTMADALGIERSAVNTVWRALRESVDEAGIKAGVTTGARGRNAPDCSPRDASDLLVATVAKIPLKSSFESWKRYSRLIARDADRVLDAVGTKKLLPQELAALEPGHSLREGLTALFASAMSGSLHKFFTDKVNHDDLVALGHAEVRFFSPYPQAIIRVHKNGEKGSVGLSFEYTDRPDGDLSPEFLDKIVAHFAARPPEERGDLSLTSTISDRTIKRVGEALRGAVTKEAGR